jgi:hypothetical protein
MRRKRPCRICRRWFLPHARCGERQRVCSRAECQRERHRRGCAEWHERNRGYDREERLRGQLTKAEAPVEVVADPLEVRIDGLAARDAVGLEVAVFVEETAKVLMDWARDAVLSQARVIAEESGRQGGIGSRVEMASSGPAP